MDAPKILIAGIGNELRQDDAFGMEFIRQWNQGVKCRTISKPWK